MSTRNLPSSPGAILGYRKNGAPIRLLAGGNGEGDSGAEGNGGDGTPSGDAGSTGAGHAEGQDGGSGGTGGRGDPGPGTAAGSGGTGASAGAQGADETPRVIAALREDFKGERARRQATEKALADFKADTERREAERATAEAERNKKLAIALGVASEDEPPDPAKLAEQLERAGTEHTAALAAKDTEIRQRDIRLAVLTQAPALGANGALLMDSLSFITRLSGLDPAAGDFTERLGEEIRTAADANPQYRLTPPPAGDPQKPAPAVPRSGGEHNGAPGGNRQLTLADVDRMTPNEVVKAQEDGLLIDLGFSPRKKRF